MAGPGQLTDFWDHIALFSSSTEMFSPYVGQNHDLREIGTPPSFFDESASCLWRVKTTTTIRKEIIHHHHHALNAVAHTGAVVSPGFESTTSSPLMIQMGELLARITRKMEKIKSSRGGYSWVPQVGYRIETVFLLGETLSMVFFGCATASFWIDPLGCEIQRNERLMKVAAKNVAPGHFLHPHPLKIYAKSPSRRSRLKIGWYRAVLIWRARAFRGSIFFWFSLIISCSEFGNSGKPWA